MRDDPSILGDRETVELLSAQPELLAIADAVKATQRKETRTWRPRPRLLVAAAALAGLAAAGALVLAGHSGGHTTSAAVRYPTPDLLHLPGLLGGHGPPVSARPPIHDCSLGCAYPPAPDQFDDAITRADGAISSIAVTLRGTRVDSTAELQVHIEGGPRGAGRVVFSEHISLNPIPPGSGGARWGTLSEWSGRLSPSDWGGGCQDAVYWLTARITNEGGGITLIQPPAFNCQRTAVGPTGRSRPTGAVGVTGQVGPTGG